MLRGFKKRQKGVSLIEISAVLIIFALITGGVVATFSTASSNALADDSITELHTLRQNIDDYLTSKGDAIGLNTGEIAQSGRMPGRWVSGSGLKNSFHGSVAVNPFSAYSYSIAFSGVSPEACLRLLSVDISPGMQNVRTQNGVSPAVGRASTPAEARGVCFPAQGDGTVTITWVFGDTTARLPGAVALTNPVQSQISAGNHIYHPGSSSTVVPYSQSQGTTAEYYSYTTRSTPPTTNSNTVTTSGGGSPSPVGNGGSGTPPANNDGTNTTTTTTPATPPTTTTATVPPVYTNSTTSGGNTASTSASQGMYSAGSAGNDAALLGITPSLSSWDPAALGLSNVQDGSFSFDHIGTNSWDALNIDPDNTFASKGYIQLTNFTNANTDTTPAGLSSGQWSLVMAYNGTGISSNQLSGNTDSTAAVAPVSLTYNSLNYSLYLIPSGNPTFDTSNNTVSDTNLAGSYFLGSGSGGQAGGTVNSYVKNDGTTNSAAYGMDTVMSGTFQVNDAIASTGFFGLQPKTSLSFATAFSDVAAAYSGSNQQAVWNGTGNADTGHAILQ